MTSTNALDLAHISMRFSDRRVGTEAIALDDVTLAVQPGEIHVLLGENGAGKTTLFKILAGMHRAGSYTGEIRIVGQPVNLRSAQDALRNGIGVVARRSGIFSKMSITENVTLGWWAENHRGFVLSRKAMEERALAILERLNLKLDVIAPANRLNAGQQRLVLIARALATDPKVIVLDEPAAFLTSTGEQAQLIHGVRLLAEQGIGCLYLARRPAEAVLIADRVTVLRDGRLNGSWPRIELDELKLTQAMMSQRIGDGDYVDHDAPEESGGFLGSLRSIFSFSKRED